MSAFDKRTLVAGDVVDFSSGPQKGLVVKSIEPYGILPKIEARSSNNSTGVKQDYSTTGVYVGNGSVALELSLYTEGEWDIVRCHSGVVHVTIGTP